MDNFREWLSDNLRYIMLGGAILIIVAVLFFGIRACVGSEKGTSDEEQTTAQDNSQGNDPSSPEDDGETNDGKKEETNPLEDGSEEVTALMNSYYKALGEKDITTLKTLVRNLTPSDESRIANAKDYIEKYQVSKVYMKKGLDDNSYVIYTSGNFICKGIQTPAPSLWSSYVVKDSDGTYKILGDLEQNTTVSAYMDSLKSDDDVKKLTAEVQAEYEPAQKNDTALAQFLAGLGEEADTSSFETSADGTTMTVTEGCNVRAEANSDSDIIGGLDEGDQIQKLGQEGDWIQIEYDGQTGYVYSGLLE